MAKTKKVKTKDEEEEKKPNLRARFEAYDKKYANQKLRQSYIYALLGVVAISLAFQLRVIPIICIAVALFMIAPRIMLALAETRYEEERFNDTTSYIEQMLYSFRRNNKILTSLQDTLLLFETGEMHDVIVQAIEYIQTQTTKGNVYEEALKIIEEKYQCRRIQSLHRYLVRVEGVGGNQDLGVDALIKDRRLWVDRVAEFRKERSSVLKEIIVSTVFSSIVSVITLYMLPAYVNAPHHAIIQAYATIFIIGNLYNIKAAISRLVFHINDISDEKHEQYVADKLDWYRNYDKKAEQKKALAPAVMGIAIAVLGIILKQWFAVIIGVVMALFAYFIQPRLKYRSTKKMLITEIETIYPDWLLELSLLLQTDNFHIALEKTLPHAPIVLRRELETLIDEIVIHPTEVEPYTNFFSFLPLQSIHSSMRLLYSIAEFGTHDEEKQLGDLIERNATLMNKAEENRNISRLSKVYMLKFVPMGTSTLKMIVDMGVFLLLFLSQTLATVV